ncbi:hypothetical protein ACFOWE_03480 [Planomonospora corallina]|uniref:Uncharacterized protein n=1 Tax=Planomonospora corallina TaxID=1806052 RepID=A0ABV8HZI5_9ACTN
MGSTSGADRPHMWVLWINADGSGSEFVVHDDRPAEALGDRPDTMS